MKTSAEIGVEHTESITKDAFASQENFWKLFLEGVSASTFSVGDSVRSKDNPSVTEYQTDIGSLTESLTSVFNDFIREHNLEISTVLQGVWALLLNRYSGDEDIVFGFQFGSKVTENSDNNSHLIPLRIKTSSETLLLPWLHQIQEQSKALQTYSQVSLGQI